MYNSNLLMEPSLAAMPLSNALEIVRLSDVGVLREHNEDAVASDDSIGLVVLADGMGGYQAGEVASEIAVLSISADIKEALLTQLPAPDTQPEPETELESAQALLIHAVKNANSAIYQASQQHMHCAGMGTTLVAGLFSNNKLLLAHVGDSRVYRLRNQHLSALTEDHSLLQEQINAGLITLDEAKISTQKNLVTRALGIEDEVEVTLNVDDIAVDDIYLFCSDGLTDMVDDYEIEAVLNSNVQYLNFAAEILIQLANEHGGHDNISVILVKVKALLEPQANWYNQFLGWLK